MTFAETLKALNKGDYVSTTDLRSFLKQAKRIYLAFLGIEAYSLVTKDLIYKINAVESYLQTRLDNRYLV